MKGVLIKHKDFESFTKEEKRKYITESLICQAASIFSSCEPMDYARADQKILVELKMPEKISEILKVVYETTEKNNYPSLQDYINSVVNSMFLMGIGKGVEMLDEMIEDLKSGKGKYTITGGRTLKEG